MIAKVDKSTTSSTTNSVTWSRYDTKNSTCNTGTTGKVFVQKNCGPLASKTKPCVLACLNALVNAVIELNPVNVNVSNEGNVLRVCIGSIIDHRMLWNGRAPIDDPVCRCTPRTRSCIFVLSSTLPKRVNTSALCTWTCKSKAHLRRKHDSLLSRMITDTRDILNLTIYRMCAKKAYDANDKLKKTVPGNVPHSSM